MKKTFIAFTSSGRAFVVIAYDSTEATQLAKLALEYDPDLFKFGELRSVENSCFVSGSPFGSPTVFAKDQISD